MTLVIACSIRSCQIRNVISSATTVLNTYSTYVTVLNDRYNNNLRLSCHTVRTIADIMKSPFKAG
jgi:hypothetical protein